jgi:poly(3-hydroxybutyrate) depolymerase
MLRWLIALTLAWSSTVCAAEASFTIPAGKSTFVFTDAKGDPSRHVTVYTYLPPGVDAATARIVFVMHGVTKDAAGYRDVWIEHADRGGFMVVAPLFDAEQWGGGAYSYASVVDRDGRIADPALWSFSLIEHLFDAIEAATGNHSARYFLYGHSEGAQFVHRLVLLLPDGRYQRAIAANAGWYTMPTAEVRFPFGLAGSPIDDDSLKKSFARDLVVLLGDRDIDPNHRQLNRTPRAMAEGSNRFERGNRFYATAKARAAELDTPFGWTLQVVPGVAHQNTRMSRAAADILMKP